MKNLQQIQDEYIAACNATLDRWSHRRNGGHSERSLRAARKRAANAILRWGFTPKQAAQIIRDADDILALARAAVDDELNHAV